MGQGVKKELEITQEKRRRNCIQVTNKAFKTSF